MALLGHHLCGQNFMLPASKDSAKMGGELLGEVTQDGQNSITYELFSSFRACTSAGSVLR